MIDPIGVAAMATRNRDADQVGTMLRTAISGQRVSVCESGALCGSDMVPRGEPWGKSGEQLADPPRDISASGRLADGRNDGRALLSAAAMI